MKLKSAALQKAINDSILDVGRGPCESDRFAIYEDTRVQVQVVVTSDPDDFMDELLPEYISA